MELFESDDYERPIETYPGYIGSYFDGDFSAEKELTPLERFDYQKYGELVEGLGGERQLTIALASGTIKIVVSAYDNVVHLLDQLPTVKVYLDNGPPDAGPASGGIYTFFIADGVSEPDLKASIDALALALGSDLASLESSTQ